MPPRTVRRGESPWCRRWVEDPVPAVAARVVAAVEVSDHFVALDFREMQPRLGEHTLATSGVSASAEESSSATSASSGKDSVSRRLTTTWAARSAMVTGDRSPFVRASPAATISSCTRLVSADLGDNRPRGLEFHLVHRSSRRGSVAAVARNAHFEISDSFRLSGETVDPADEREYQTLPDLPPPLGSRDGCRTMPACGGGARKRPTFNRSTQPENPRSEDCWSRAPKERQAVAWGVSPRNPRTKILQAAERRQMFNINKGDPRRGTGLSPLRGSVE